MLSLLMLSLEGGFFEATGSKRKGSPCGKIVV